MTNTTQYNIEDLQPMLQKVMEYFESQIAEQYWDIETWNNITGSDDQQLNHAIYTFVFNAPHDVLMNLTQAQFDSRMEQAAAEEEAWNVNQLD